MAPPRAGAQSDGTDAPVFAVALGSSLADVGAATLLVAAGQADAVLMVDAPDMAGTAAIELVAEHGASAFVLVGGPAAVSSAVEDELAASAPRAKVSRVWGADREATAASVAHQVLGICPDPRGAVVALANGWSAPDAAAAAAAVATGSVDAVLWTSANALGDAAAGVLKDFSVRRVLVIGGPMALSEQAADAALTAAGATVRRVGGATRADTAVKVARLATPRRISATVIADGWNLPAASQAAALAAAAPDTAVLFNEPDGTLGDAATQFLADSMPKRIWVLSSNQTTRDTLVHGAQRAAPEAQIAEIDSPTAAATAAIQASRQQDSQAGSCIDASGSTGGESSGPDGGGSSSGGGGPQPPRPPPTTPERRYPVPPAVTGFMVTFQGPSSAVVSWDPYPTLASISELKVTWDSAVDPVGDAGEATLALTATSYTITGLTPGTQYQFAIRPCKTYDNPFFRSCHSYSVWRTTPQS